MLRYLLERHFPHEDIEPGGIWLRVRMRLLDTGQRSGWKIHLSATPASYVPLLNTALPLLEAARVPFKLLADIDAVERMASGEYGLMQTGKCVTIYPATEEDAANLSQTLSGALRGISGPSIPTDIPFCADAPVYFRFGPYDGHVEINAMGQERRLLWRPDLGGTVWDSTSGGPLEMPPRTYLPAHSAPDHLAFLRDEYQFVRVLQLTAKGGVFLAHARSGNSAPLLIKTARRHTNSDIHGRDAVWALHKEHSLLDSLRGLPGIPDAGRIITDDTGAAIVRPFIEGKTFWEHWTAPDARMPERRAFLQRALDSVRRTAEALHGRGIVLRDLSPGNILIAPSGTYLMDFELAHSMNDPAPPYRRGTRGFFDPDRPIGSAPTPGDDEFALAALGRMLVSGNQPDDRSSKRKASTNIDATGILRMEVLRCLELPATQSSWNVYDGVAGIVLAADALDIAPETIGITRETSAALLRAAEAVLHIPGYHFGAGGYAAAAGLLGLLDEAEAIVRRVSGHRSTVPDICQGLAGQLLACIDLFERCGRAGFHTQALEVRDRLLDMAQDDDGALVWRWPEGPYGDLSGAACFGFGHGLAGVLFALLRAESVGPSPRARGFIERGLVTLVREAQVVPGTRDALWWPVSRVDATCWNAWCHGTPGIVKTLAAAARAGLADAPLLHAALRGMCLANNSGPCLCHGIASRLDAMNDCMEVFGQTPPDALMHAAQNDFDALEAIAASPHFAPAAEDSTNGLMTGLPGILLTLHRARTWR